MGDTEGLDAAAPAEQPAAPQKIALNKSGGGVIGVAAYIGEMAAWEAVGFDPTAGPGGPHQYEIVLNGGTSAGGIASLVQSTGPGAAEAARELLLNTNISKVVDRPPLDHIPILGAIEDGASVIMNGGVVKGDKMEATLRTFFQKARGVNGWGDLKTPTLVTTFDVEAGKELTFTTGPASESARAMYPQIDLARAGRATSSIPLAFAPVTSVNATDGKTHHFWDGAIGEHQNLPTQSVQRWLHAHGQDNVRIVSTVIDAGHGAANISPQDPFYWPKLFVHGLMSQFDVDIHTALSDPVTGKDTATIDLTSMASADWNLTNQQKTFLMDKGFVTRAQWIVNDRGAQLAKDPAAVANLRRIAQRTQTELQALDKSTGAGAQKPSRLAVSRLVVESSRLVQQLDTLAAPGPGLAEARPLATAGATLPGETVWQRINRISANVERGAAKLADAATHPVKGSLVGHLPGVVATVTTSPAPAPAVRPAQAPPDLAAQPAKAVPLRTGVEG